MIMGPVAVRLPPLGSCWLPHAFEGLADSPLVRRALGRPSRCQSVDRQDPGSCRWSQRLSSLHQAIAKERSHLYESRSLDHHGLPFLIVDKARKVRSIFEACAAKGNEKPEIVRTFSTYSRLDFLSFLGSWRSVKRKDPGRSGRCSGFIQLLLSAPQLLANCRIGC